MAGIGKIYITAVRTVGEIRSTHQYDVDVRFNIAFDYGGYNNTGASYSITCDGQTQTGIATFSVGNGGGNWVWANIGGTKTFRVTMPASGQTKTISFSAEINTKINPATISASGSHTLAAVVWEHTVSFNANGGTGAPGSQKKIYGTILTLPSTKPTRSGYIFAGWATSSAGDVAYAAGGAYGADKDATLYAVWQIAYIPPTITGLAGTRCTSSGTASNSGTYIKVTGSWKVDTSISSSNKATKLKIEYRASTVTAWTSASDTNPAAASGTLSIVIGGGNISTGSAYYVRVTVTDSGGNTQATTTVAAQFRPVDIGNEGKTVAFGGVASNTQGVEFYTQARFMGGMQIGGKTVADFVTEQGTSGNWSYRKWNSGIGECWARLDYDGLNASGDKYYHFSHKFPFTFSANPVLAVAGGATGDPGAVIKYCACSTVGIDVYLYSTTVGSTGKVGWLTAYAIGKLA